MMMHSLTSTEQQGVRRLMTAGFTRAAQALSQMVHRPVRVETVRMNANRADMRNTVSGSVDAETVLITEVVGEVGGRSYLMFSDQESHALQVACLPAALKGPQRTIMGEAVLKEIDNVLSATVITTLSEELKLSIYGGAPQLSLSGAPKEKNRTSNYSLSEDEHCLFVSTRFFIGKKPLGQSQFIWSFPPAFVALLKDYSNDTPPNPSP